jgi:hypothetical protein
MDTLERYTGTASLPCGKWSFHVFGSERSALLSCPKCGFIFALSSFDISEKGRVTPLVFCPAPCGYSEYVELEDWEGALSSMVVVHVRTRKSTHKLRMLVDIDRKLNAIARSVGIAFNVGERQPGRQKLRMRLGSGKEIKNSLTLREAGIDEGAQLELVETEE